MNTSIQITPLEQQLNATVLLPGSKSITNRALILSACCSGFTILEHVLESEDTQIMLGALRELGVTIDRQENKISSQDNIIISGLGGLITKPNAEIYIGNSGTSVRFLTALLALSGRGEYRLYGKPRMHQRPISGLVDALRFLGANIRYENNNGSPPLFIGCRNKLGKKIIESGKVEIAVSGDVSSQFLSAVLMTAPIASDEIDVEIIVTEKLVSRPYVEMTINIMESFGVKPTINNDFTSFRFHQGEFYHPPGVYRIEPDASAASYFFAAAAICGGTIQIEGLSQKSVQGDIKFVDCLEQMGCTVKFDNEKNTTTVSRSPNKPIKGISVDMNYISDTAQTLGVVALFAEGTTEIKNIEHVRYKETDRIAALATELRRFGATVEEQHDGLKIIPPAEIKPATVETYDDHRMAMSFAAAGLKIDGVVIKNPDCVQKTFPNFFNELKKLLVVSG
ncbi:MAG: 3-phosphoshikimate 1-carboxyvinyltransferase [Planctomycetaceae bacterium]|jgi:3-phosphoshikimate 1-carboxyvinyltransferase|nr:3-phosphoshikimate 1-carboxyvinyltransferase [Planctomycetaceae bacterium]